MGYTRLEFKDLLKEIAEEVPDGDPSVSVMVVGQEPPNTTMVYPAIRYEKNDEDAKHADNVPYDIVNRYAVTVIEKDPNTPIANKIRQLPMSSFNRYYVADNLNHTVYNIFY